MKEIAIEDLATLLITEFVKQNKGKLRGEHSSGWNSSNIPFLKMNFNARRKLVSKVLDTLLIKGE